MIDCQARLCKRENILPAVVASKSDFLCKNLPAPAANDRRRIHFIKQLSWSTLFYSRTVQSMRILYCKLQLQMFQMKSSFIARMSDFSLSSVLIIGISLYFLMYEPNWMESSLQLIIIRWRNLIWCLPPSSHKWYVLKHLLYHGWI